MQRTRLVINVGNLLELVAAAVACYAVDRLAGLSWALLLAALLLAVGAEFIYDASVLRVPLPRRPRLNAHTQVRWSSRRTRFVDRVRALLP